MEILGIDIGGSGIKGAIVDTATGELKSERIRLVTPQPATPEAVAQTLNELVDQKSNTFKLLITLRKFRPMLINVFDIQRVELHRTFYSRCI